jgi:hypothetical protein
MSDFEQVARTRGRENVLGEFWYFLKSSKKWWLLPILLVLLVFGVLVFLSGTAAAPFIYTLY